MLPTRRISCLSGSSLQTEPPSAHGRGVARLMGAGRLYLPFRIKGRKHVHVQHEPHVRDTQMNMCQRHGNESRARGSLGSLGLRRPLINPCQVKEAADTGPTLTDTDGPQRTVLS